MKDFRPRMKRVDCARAIQAIDFFIEHDMVHTAVEKVMFRALRTKLARGMK